MAFLGLHVAVWMVLVVYFAGMLLMGWWSRRGIHDQEGYLLGNRRFGVWMMVMHAFGAGTNPGDVAGVVSKTVSGGASGIWVSWMWMFGTPFYWLIAPIVRRMRCLTLADFFQERFGKPASALYILVATAGMIVCLASVLLATARTAQGLMGKATAEVTSVDAPDGAAVGRASSHDEASGDARPTVLTPRESEAWFFGILLVTTAVFLVYSYWGGIVAAIRTDMVQGLMIIALSVIAIPMALNLKEVGGLAGMRQTLAATDQGNLLSLFDPGVFDLWTVIVLCINAPLSALAFPHLIPVCGAGRTEWEGRVGFTYGNMLKRICTIGWCLLGLAWLAYLLETGSAIHPDAAFGDSIRMLLSPLLQGVMLACVLATAMSSGDAFQITVAGLFSENIYRVYIRPGADEKHMVHVTRIAGIVIVLVSLVVAVLMRQSVVGAILDYFNILSLVGVSTAMGILWRRMNTTGMFCSTISAVIVFVITRYVGGLPRHVTIAAPILVGLVAGVVGSLLTRPPNREALERFLAKIYVPIGQEARLALPLDEAVPPSQRWLTAGGLFVVKPSRQSWLGFLVTFAICVLCVVVMQALLKG
ncbi:sodium:solute symporter family protein [Anaerobaca lacustris]|uniref:Sodium:solute symporter family protein n=1 Tax=Anaerobaca lacustris TaxID=3044600 RepID=A0AAW6TU80_9BACT|nr:sodium:solute symporter family protein [Sedimentisphaerales bacterium M17dextr]